VPQFFHAQFFHRQFFHAQFFHTQFFHSTILPHTILPQHNSSTHNSYYSERLAYPLEVLNSLTIFGFPPHKLTLKKGCVLMLLRNLKIRAGLFNGTRLIVREMKNNVIVAHMLKEKALGPRR
jgi:hypothetical protein